MNIEKVKLQENGYLVNDTISVPNAEGNRHYKMVQDAIAGGMIVEPQFTEAEIDANKLQEDLNIAQVYLDKTDHKMLNNYVLKDGEILADIIIQRDSYREFIRANEN